MRLQTSRVVALASTLVAFAAFGGEKLVQNDSFTGMGQVSVSVQFGDTTNPGSQGAGVYLVPDAADYPAQIIGFDILCMPISPATEGSPAAYVLDVWDESQGPQNPPMTGTPNVVTTGVQLTAASNAFNRFTLNTPRTITSGGIFVKLIDAQDSQDDGTTIGMDPGPAVAKRNYFYDFGVPGEIGATGSAPYNANKNWIIRAVLNQPDPMPTVTAITPNTKAAAESITVTIDGTNFTSTSKAFLGSTELAVLTRTPPSSLTATVPNTLQPGVYNVSVRNGASQGTLPNAFTVTGPPMPDGGMDQMDAGTQMDGGTGGQDAGTDGGVNPDALTLESIDPADAFSGEDTDLVLLGTNFQEGVQLIIGKKLIEPITRKSSSVIQATLVQKALPAGTYDVTVINPDGARATLQQALTVHEGTSVKTGCSCNSVSPFAAFGALALVVVLRRRRSFGGRVS